MTNQKNRDHSQIGILMLVMLLRIYSFFDVYGYKTFSLLHYEYELFCE